MKSILLFITSIVSITYTYSQNVIVVQNNTQESFYTNIDSAITHATSGDFIYLPGGSFTPSGGILQIDKKINIIGAGHFADSSRATGQTIINGTVKIITGADGGLLQGLYINGEVYFGTSTNDDDTNGYSISRCYISGLFSTSSTSSSINTLTENINISENVLNGYINLSNAKNIFLNKNILLSYIKQADGQVVCRNNLFLIHANYACNSTPTFHDIKGTLFYDNIVNNLGCAGIYAGGFTGNAFYNNIFSANISFPFVGNPGVGNIVNELADSIYISHGNGIYAEQYNYHLRANSSGKNAGSDGTDIGLYGTAYPYKEGAIPMNPHVSKKIIATETDSQGNLNVNIKVKAQER